MPLFWHYEPTAPFATQGADSTQHNFSREERSSLTILTRECLQNALDARLNNDAPVRVSIRVLHDPQFDPGYLSELFPAEFKRHLHSAMDRELPAANDPVTKVLVIEDFGTTGLQGTYRNPDADGPGENWNAFWQREGQGAKNRASLGGAGQGKITYYKQSNASTVLGLTVRASDGKQLLMGRANFLRDYHHDGKKFQRCAYLTISSQRPTPEMDSAELQRFKGAFQLKRAPGESGLSLVVPFASDFVAAEAIQAVVLEFYVPIVRGRLSVTIGEVEISAETVDDIASLHVTDELATRLHSSFTSGYRKFVKEILVSGTPTIELNEGWEKDRRISDACFPTGSIDALRRALDEGKRVALRLPLKVKRKGAADELTKFDVYLETSGGLERTEEAFLRRDLVIGGETPLERASLVQKARALTHIESQPLSDFLLAAEEPSHLKWNASLARDKGTYRSAEDTLRAVRQAASRLLAAILGGEVARDTKALAKFFAKPAPQPTGRKDDVDGRDGVKDPPPPLPSPPPPIPKYFRYESAGAAVRLLPNAKFPLTAEMLPLEGQLEVAYEELDGDPFSAYDPFDFDLKDLAEHPIATVGMKVLERRLNKIVVLIDSPEFELAVAGFSEHIRLKARFTYDLHAGDDAESKELEAANAQS